MILHAKILEKCVREKLDECTILNENDLNWNGYFKSHFKTRSNLILYVLRTQI